MFRSWQKSVLVAVPCVAAFSMAVLPHLGLDLSRAAWTAAPTAASSADELSTAFTAVAERIRPSVVNIASAKKVTPPQMQWMPFSGDRFQEFFGRSPFVPYTPYAPHTAPRMPQPKPKSEHRVQKGLGTGFIVSEDGHILTNHHVVRGADEIIVKLHDGATPTALSRSGAPRRTHAPNL